jgi:hypothetical protein
MSYQELEGAKINHPVIREVIEHADTYLNDTYEMFYLPIEGKAKGGGCNFSIVLVLLCVIDGIARDVYPTKKVGDHETRFKGTSKNSLIPSDFVP